MDAMTRRTRWALASLLAAALGCVDPPFAHVNPNDEATPLEMSLVGGADTVFTVGQYLLFRLVTDPAVPGYPPGWSSSSALYLESQGGGVFVVRNLPAAGALNVTIRASFQARSVERVVRVLSAPP